MCRHVGSESDSYVKDNGARKHVRVFVWAREQRIGQTRPVAGKFPEVEQHRPKQLSALFQPASYRDLVTAVSAHPSTPGGLAMLPIREMRNAGWVGAPGRHAPQEHAPQSNHAGSKYGDEATHGPCADAQRARLTV
jgi:hypothetical protein